MSRALLAGRRQRSPKSDDAAVWITGRGVMCPIGQHPDALADALERQRSGVRLFPGEAAMGLTPYSVPAAPLAGEPTTDALFDAYWPHTMTALLDRGSVLALRAAQAAWADAGLTDGACDPERIGVAWGSGMGGAVTTEQSYVDLLAPAPRRLHPFTVVRAMANAAASQIAIHHGINGPVLSVANACASAAQAIGEGLQWVRAGRADMVVVGGSDAPLLPGILRAWQAMGVVAKVDPSDVAAACRPFDRRRSGLVLGEGAGALVLERASHARARGARPLAVLAGYGTTCDAVHLSRPDESGQIRAMRQALDDAGVAPDDIGHINAHGTGTMVGDGVEARAIHAAFGAHRPAVSAGKAAHGHLMGAAGAVECIAALEALRRGCIPPTAHLQHNDCQEWIDVVQGEVLSAPLQAVLSNSFAFGGTNVSLLLQQA